MNLREFLMDLPYPLERDEIVALAEEEQLDPEYLQLLEQMPDREYDTVADVALETGAIRGT